MKNIFTCTLFLFSLCLQAQTDSLDKQKIDAYFDSLEKENKFMGSVLLTQNGKPVFARQIGYADIASQSKSTINSRYRIGSISKTFTATLLLMAVEEGKIKLDATINPYFPELTNADSITIAQLLYHQSGIHDFTTNTDYLEWNTKPIGKNQLLDIIIKGGSDFQPGTNTVYSNSNYVLLTLLLEKIYGISYPKLLESKITNPARLKDTYFGKPSDIRDNECFSYTFQGEWVREKETDMSVPLGAGSIVSTPADIAKFAHQLFQGRILTKTSLEIMKTAPGQFGMGLIKIPFYHRNGYGHTGGIDGFHSVFAYFPDMEICLVICSNATNFKINDISIALLCTAYNLPFDVPVFSKFKPTADQLAKYAGIYQGEEIPLKITIKQKENTLVAQATGQPAFGLEAFEKDKFRFEQAGIIIEFQAESNSFLLKQGGGIFHFSKL